MQVQTFGLDRWYANDGPGVWPGPLTADEVKDPAGDLQSGEA